MLTLSKQKTFYGTFDEAVGTLLATANPCLAINDKVLYTSRLFLNKQQHSLCCACSSSCTTLKNSILLINKRMFLFRNWILQHPSDLTWLRQLHFFFIKVTTNLTRIPSQSPIFTTSIEDIGWQMRFKILLARFVLARCYGIPPSHRKYGEG
jgi:hypothetical protein